MTHPNELNSPFESPKTLTVDQLTGFEGSINGELLADDVAVFLNGAQLLHNVGGKFDDGNGYELVVLAS